MNEMNNQQPPLICEEYHIPFGQRLSDAVQRFFTAIANSLICLCLAPVVFFRVLFTSKRKVWRHNPLFRGFEDQGQININLNQQAPNDEDWKKLHDELYGNDDEDV